MARGSLASSPAAQLGLFTPQTRGGLLVKEYHSLRELEAFWEPVFINHGEAAAAWESPQKRLDRFTRALEGILAVRSDIPEVLLIQASAAFALGRTADAARHLAAVADIEARGA